MRPELFGVKRRGIWQDTFDRTHWVWFLGLLVLFVGLRWNNYNAPLGRDEGEYAYSAQILLSGAAPYEHAFLQKPPMVVYSYWSGRMCPG